MSSKIIIFLKKYYQAIVASTVCVVGAILLFYGIFNTFPLQNLERDYQIDTFGFYDSSVKYLKDVDDSLSYFNIYVGIGFALLFADLIYCLLTFLDMYNNKKKKSEVKSYD